MNKVYLFGQVIYKSNLKYCISPKLEVHMECVIRTCDGNEFNCIVPEKLCNKLVCIKLGDYIYTMGHVVNRKDYAKIYLDYMECI